MSDQPPSDQPPNGQPPYGQPPYGQPPYGQAGATWPNTSTGPYAPPVPQKSSAGRIIAIVVGVVALLACGGCLAFGAVLYTTGKDVIREIDSYQSPEATGLVSVEPGQTFLVGDYSIADGWVVEVSGPVATIRGMTATRVGEPRLSTVAFDMTFLRGAKVLGIATCSGTVEGDSDRAEVACVVSDRKVRRADRVEIQSLI